VARDHDVLTFGRVDRAVYHENLPSRHLSDGDLSLEHGNSDGSCYAYVWLGVILGVFGRLPQRSASVSSAGPGGAAGLGRFEDPRPPSLWAPRYSLTQPLPHRSALVRRAFDAANKLGDLTFAAYSRNNLITNLIAGGDPLGDVQREAEAGLDFARQARFGLAIDLSTPAQAHRTLRGLTPEFGSFNDTEFDEGRFEQHLGGGSAAGDRPPAGTGTTSCRRASSQGLRFCHRGGGDRPNGFSGRRRISSSWQSTISTPR